VTREVLKTPELTLDSVRLNADTYRWDAILGAAALIEAPANSLEWWSSPQAVLTASDNRGINALGSVQADFRTVPRCTKGAFSTSTVLSGESIPRVDLGRRFSKLEEPFRKEVKIFGLGHDTGQIGENGYTAERFRWRQIAGSNFIAPFLRPFTTQIFVQPFFDLARRAYELDIADPCSFEIDSLKVGFVGPPIDRPGGSFGRLTIQLQITAFEKSMSGIDLPVASTQRRLCLEGFYGPPVSYCENSTYDSNLSLDVNLAEFVAGRPIAKLRIEVSYFDGAVLIDYPSLPFSNEWGISELIVK
jgi:hypothetical protein